jgi:hypothetical protein
MINRRLKPHRRPCAHFWSGRKSCGPPRGEKSLLPPVDNGHKRRFRHCINSDEVFGTHTWTTVTFSRNTSDFVKAMKEGAISAGLAGLPGVTPLARGVVIEAGGSLLGAVGVAGAPGGDKDEVCAKAGLAAVQDKLEF